MKYLSKAIAASVASLTLLTGCNGFPTPFVHDPVYSQYFVVNSGPPLPLLFQGSAIQWNEEYAVTAKHIPFLWNVAHRGRGDLVFFRHPAKQVPQWRQYVPGEQITSAGFSPFLVSVRGTGHALTARARIENMNDGVAYAFGDMPVVTGMSGGPVFAADHQVVGITVAFIPVRNLRGFRTKELAGSERVSVFMPYDEIAREWTRFQSKLEPKTAPAPILAAH